MSDTETGKTHTIQLQAATGRMVELFGSRMYDPDIVNVVLKEMVQNSVDAIRVQQRRGAIERGVIDITTDANTRTITVKDNGAGMTPDTVRNAFFTIGGSDKSELPPDQRSGGLGLATLALISGSQSLSLSTVRERVKVEVNATSERIRGGSFEMVETAAHEPSGTSVTIVFPERVSRGSGEPGVPVHIPVIPMGVKVLNGFFNAEDIDVRVNGQSAVNKPPQERIDTLKFGWGRVDVYFGRKSEAWPRHQVLSAGVAQFNEYFSVPGEYAAAPFDVAVDVRSDVPATHPEYPFNDQREGWRGTVRKDAERIQAHVSGLIHDATRKEIQEQLSALKLLSRVNPRAPDRVRAASPASVRLEAVQGGSGAQGSSNIQDLSAGKPLLHSNLNIDLAAAIDAKLAGHNKPPDAMQFFSELGSVVTSFTEAAAKIPGYERLGSYRAGLSFDIEYAGTNVSEPFSVLFVNPFNRAVFETLESSEEVAGAFLLVMKHEAIHELMKEHGESFHNKLANFDGKLHKGGENQRLLQAAQAVLGRHWDTYLIAREIYGSTRNAGKSLTGARLAGSGLGTDTRNAEGGDSTLQNGRRERGISAGMAGTADATGDTGPRTHARDVGSVADRSMQVRQSAVQEYRRRTSQQEAASGPVLHGTTPETGHEL